MVLAPPVRSSWEVEHAEDLVAWVCASLFVSRIIGVCASSACPLRGRFPNGCHVMLEISHMEDPIKVVVFEQRSMVSTTLLAQRSRFEQLGVLQVRGACVVGGRD